MSILSLKQVHMRFHVSLEHISTLMEAMEVQEHLDQTALHQSMNTPHSVRWYDTIIIIVTRYGYQLFNTYHFWDILTIKLELCTLHVY